MLKKNYSTPTAEKFLMKLTSCLLLASIEGGIAGPDMGDDLDNDPLEGLIE